MSSELGNDQLLHSMDNNILCIVLLAICLPTGCTVASGIVVIVFNCSQMRTIKCTCLIFGVSIGFDPG